MTQKLTLAEVKAKAREYYAAGKLTAQHPDPNKRKCVNTTGDGYRCAVAAAFNDDVLAKFPTGGLGLVVGQEVVSIDTRDEYFEILDIQGAHDSWAISAAEYESEAKDFEERFLALIQD